MANRTFAIGDLVGDLEARTVRQVAALDADDTLVLGTPIGPQSAETIEPAREPPVRAATSPRVATMRRLARRPGGWPEFVIPPATVARTLALPAAHALDGDTPARHRAPRDAAGVLLPDDVVDEIPPLIT